MIFKRNTSCNSCIHCGINIEGNKGVSILRADTSEDRSRDGPRTCFFAQQFTTSTHTNQMESEPVSDDHIEAERPDDKD